jgi:hypothetical protein
VDAVTHSSATYTYLRVLFQIANWLVATLCGWLVAVAFRDEADLSRTFSTICRMGLLLSLYAIYQWVADRCGLPLTGIRRPWVGVTAGAGGEDLAAYFVEMDRFYRPNSFACEPKDYAAFCVFWTTLLLARMAFWPCTYRQTLQFLVIAAGLYLSAATSGWAAFLGVVVLGIHTALRRPEVGFRWLWQLGLPAAILSAAAIVSLGLRCGDLAGHLDLIVEERWTSRIDNPLGDLPEEAAKEILHERPQLGIFGVGMGGISFYIAQSLGGSDLILYPNNGLLAWICNLGIVGLALWYLTFQQGVWAALRVAPNGGDRNVPMLAFLGLALMIQSLVYTKLPLLSLSMGCLLAAEFRCDRRQVAGRGAARACGRARFRHSLGSAV